ncbi:MAG: RtcB family protein [Chitinophagales bacterium]|nr:RtcB family protein [Chitinophagales bacterium]
MKKLKITGEDLRKLNYPEDRTIAITLEVINKHYKHSTLNEVEILLQNILLNPMEFIENEPLNKIANALIEYNIKQLKKGNDNHLTISKTLLEDMIGTNENEYLLNETGVELTTYGLNHIEEGAIKQINTAIKLPVAIAGALMPDAHQGYGLPIGGVLATNNAVIPFGVGVDIGCRMCMSIFDIDAHKLKEKQQYFENILKENTLFGAGREFTKHSNHEVLDRKEFDENPLLKSLQFKATKQLGSSGSGNHFVEFGWIEITEENQSILLPKGKYLALLSHSGSRGLGATVANHYTKLAIQQCKLPKEAKHLAWLDLNTEAGMEYWIAMNLAGDYASACHHTIHQKIEKALNEKAITIIENHHNFAWKEMYKGQEVIVHRKGATPAGKGVLGIIPGSMTAPGFIVSGKGNEQAINSASHGAGRKMSRTKAKESITHNDLKKLLKDNGVTLIGGGLDEAPQAYKDIEKVMKHQTDLVDILAKFYPKIVIMDKN